jgi:Protein of unknown function (DUF1194)
VSAIKGCAFRETVMRVHVLWRLTAIVLTVLTLAVSGANPGLAEDVDLELVLAADGSGSIDDDELQLQRNGWAEAIASPDVLNAIRGGLTGKIAVMYFEWGSATSQVVIVDWGVISDKASAESFAEQLRIRPRGATGYNSISTAIDFAVERTETNAIKGLRKVIDVSADSGNYGGRPIREARDAALALGYTINALTILRPGGRPGRMDGANTLEDYFSRNVIGGPGAFVEIADERQPFKIAARRKLFQEIAGVGDGGRFPRRVRAAAGARQVGDGFATGDTAQFWQGEFRALSVRRPLLFEFYRRPSSFGVALKEIGVDCSPYARRAHSRW